VLCQLAVVFKAWREHLVRYHHTRLIPKSLCCLVLLLGLAVSSPLQARAGDTSLSAAATNGLRTIPTVLAPAEISIEAKSAVLLDSITGEILVARHADKKIPPASFAKLLTLYVIFDMIQQHKLRLDDEVYVSKKAWRTGGSKMFIEVNDKVRAEELIKGITIVSGNDASVAMAEHLFGDTETFAKVMNKYAANLGMTQSLFANPHGLPQRNQYTTARDMATLAMHYVNDFPHAVQYHAMQEYTYGGIKQQNRNGLLKKDSSVDGLKTGWVESSGYNLVATAQRNKHRLIAVVMGAETPAMREREALKLLNYGYQNFSLLALFQEDGALTELPVWKGKDDMLPVVPQQRSAVIVPREYAGNIQKVSVLPDDIVAPVRQGQVVGEYVIKVGTKTLKSIPLIAGASVGRAGFLKVASHQVYLFGRDIKTHLIIVTGSLASVGAVAMLILFGKRRRRRSSFRI
jgi:D-alanyl-D-alanine carboxypeptidase (penicillin-binding protein 5/6)